MKASAALPEPLLSEVPDARRGPIRLLEPVMMPYLGLMVGGLGAGLAAAVNAGLVRRFGVAGLALAIGVASWAALVAITTGLGPERAIESIALLLLAGRAVGFGVGWLLMRRQNALVRGHQHLGGEGVPVLWGVVVVFALLLFALPGWILVLSLGIVPLNA